MSTACVLSDSFSTHDPALADEAFPFFLPCRANKLVQFVREFLCVFAFERNDDVSTVWKTHLDPSGFDYSCRLYVGEVYM